jgi:quinol monooxygenase YgiN
MIALSLERIMRLHLFTKAVCAAVLLLTAAAAVGDDQPANTSPSLPERLERALKADDKPFALVIQIAIRPGVEAKFEAAAAKAAKASLGDEGCLAYAFNRNLEKPGHYVLVERWSGLAALRKHLAQPHTKQILAAMEELAAGPRTVEIFAPVSGQR